MKDKLHPDAEKALRKLLLEVWLFQEHNTNLNDADWDTPLDDSEPTKNQKFCSLFVDLDEVAYRGLKLLGFESWEELEKSVWAKKPEEVLECEPCIDMDHQKGYK